MTQLKQVASECKLVPQDYLLNVLRCVRVRAQLFCNEVDCISNALQHNLITQDLALDWLDDAQLEMFRVPELGREVA